MTIKKAGYRSMPVISREADNLEESPVLPNWMKEFANSLNKVSVQPYRQESVFEQINSIINSSKPKYSSVEDAVREMQERSGLTAYQNKMRVLAQTVKNAGCSCEDKENKKETPKIKIFEIKPQIQHTLDNFIQDTKGNLPIPSIIDRIKSIHSKDVSDDSAWDDDGLLKYINDKSIDVKKMNPDNCDDEYTTLGQLPKYDEKDIDQSNSDALFSLTPANVNGK